MCGWLFFWLKMSLGGELSWKFKFPPLTVLGEKDIALAVHPLYALRSRAHQCKLEEATVKHSLLKMYFFLKRVKSLQITEPTILFKNE